MQLKSLKVLSLLLEMVLKDLSRDTFPYKLMHGEESPNKRITLSHLNNSTFLINKLHSIETKTEVEIVDLGEIIEEVETSEIITIIEIKAIEIITSVEEIIIEILEAQAEDLIIETIETIETIEMIEMIEVIEDHQEDKDQLIMIEMKETIEDQETMAIKKDQDLDNKTIVDQLNS